MSKVFSLTGFSGGGVLFDLDGTVADTATDLSVPINTMRAERGLAPLPLNELRPFASMGARGLLKKGLGVTQDHADFDSLREDFLRRYEANMCDKTKLFDGMAQVLDALDSAKIPWGIVSNKVERYVRPIAGFLGIAGRSKSLIGGDTTGFAKPHPQPLYLGAKQLGLEPNDCIYVGDDERDVIAGRAAGMRTAAAGWGYLGIGKSAHDWGADFVLSSPSQLLQRLGLP